jgi:CRISPR-associated protein Cas5h
MEILSFKISGKMAHFRKYYANNTAFSFSIPPRTALMGMVAAAMGLPKDSYYEDLASENIQFGIRVLSPLKKSFHRLNFMRIGSNPKDFRGYSSRPSERSQTGPIQTPFEVITAWDLSKGDVVYQVFLKAEDRGEMIYESIKTHFLEKEPIYNITLGTANFTASFSDIQIFKKNQIEIINANDYVQIHSAVPVGHVEDLKFDKEEFGNYNFVEEDMLPGDFVANGNREVRKMNRLLFSITPNPLRVKLKGSFYVLKSDTGELNIQFMDA